ncbi:MULTISPECIES: dimethylmenaquinone methyltransferase [unclassified Agrobacterium]|uniref:RraA family protein n=1 Tax=unclassified Agrobacterium TaxID=2632611 RepID=UPI00083D75AE|nr:MULTISPECIES: dimethylmenaquinone methyltransferase [unclassified Agrobacterium]AOG12750.1 demethylmenaquinone methyltransferase family protein [Agrobacterium sp. RAC06]QGG93453.1 ribonuclease activity regulator RraA [Agrobacterium sp. MA01]
MDRGFRDSDPVSEAVLDMLRQCGQGTLTTQLFKRGYRQQFLVGLAPLSPTTGRFAGEAFTLRFIPSREDKDWDLGDLHKRGVDNLQWEAVETIGPGQVLVIDSRNDPRAASAGNMLLTRLMRRGAVAAITDGAFRDGTEIKAMPIPAYCRANTASTRPAFHRAVGINEPIGCADVAVYPGDIIVGDADGVTVIPRHIAADVAQDALEQEQREAFLFTKIDAGAPLWGTYPANSETLAEFETLRSKGAP